MSAISEISILPITASTLDSSDARMQYIKAVDVLKQQPGFCRLLAGHSQENHKELIWMTDWETIDHHENFMSKPIYSQFLRSLDSIFEHDLLPGRYHVELPHGRYTTPRTGEVTSLAELNLIKKADTGYVLGELDALTARAVNAKPESTPGAIAIGPVIEPLNRIIVLTTWMSPEEHKAFAHGPEYSPWVRRKTTISKRQ